MRLIHCREHYVDLHIQQREHEGIVILDLEGRLVLGSNDVALRQRLQAIHDEGHKNVALNLKHVSELDTTALGTLIYCATKFRESGGRIVLFSLSPAHSELSNIVKLNTAFEIYPDEVSALNSFFPERAVRHYDILEFVENMEQRQHAGDFETGAEKGNGQAKRSSKEIPK
jgi:anti-sigma B factor antagonist